MTVQECWNNFLKTGRVSDYLVYRRAAGSSEVAALEADNRSVGDMGNQNG